MVGMCVAMSIPSRVALQLQGAGNEQLKMLAPLTQAEFITVSEQ